MGPIDRASAALVLFLLPFIAAAAGAYLGAYLRKKGENLATHEDIEKLDDQVRVVTTTAKEIEAKISDELWNRQKRWELKREVLFEVAKSLAEIDGAIIGLDSLLQVETKPDELGWLQIESEKYAKWNAPRCASMKPKYWWTWYANEKLAKPWRRSRSLRVKSRRQSRETGTQSFAPNPQKSCR